MEKLLAIVSLTQRAYGRWLFQRLLSGMLLIAGLVIITSMMIGAMLIGGLYAAYFMLLSYEIGQLMAIFIIAILALLIITGLFALIFLCLNRLRQMPQNLLKQSTLTSSVMNAMDAFTEGLMAE